MDNEYLENEKLANSTERSGFDQGVNGDDQAGIKEGGYGDSHGQTASQGRTDQPWGAQASRKGDTETQVIGEPLKT